MAPEVPPTANATDHRMARDLELTADRADERLDAFLARVVPDLSRSHAQKLIEGGRVTVNDRRAKPALRLSPGDRVHVSVPEPQSVAPAPEPIRLAVMYEDRDLIVVDKPPGLTVHPAPGHPSGTLVNALLAHCADLAGINGNLRPGIVHRLDQETSGLLVVAKSDYAQLALSRQFAGREVLKAYLALVEGRPPPAGVIDAPIGRHPTQRKRMAVIAEGRPARTHYRVVTQLADVALVVAVLETGRTHQVRVHFAAIGHPVVGDAVYGHRSPLVPRQFLHAWQLGFHHPRTGTWLEFEAPLPGDLQAALATLLQREGSGRVAERIAGLLQSARAAVPAIIAAPVTVDSGHGQREAL